MDKNTTTILTLVAIGFIAASAIIASVFILSDGNPLNNGSVWQIASFSGGLMVSVLTIIKMMASLHHDVNSRLTELLEAAKRASHAEGMEEGRVKEQASVSGPPQEVVILPDPTNPVPVVLVEKPKE